MTRTFATLVTFAMFAAAGMAAQTPMADHPGFRDPELFSRIPGYFIATSGSFLEKQYERREFSVTRGGKTEIEPVEGHLRHYYYTFDVSRGAAASSLQIVRNYQNAARKIGGKVVWETVRQTDTEETTLLIEKDGREFWVHVDPTNGGMNYHLVIVERGAMRQDVAANAEAFKAGLAQAGHVEVPGIYFDTAKADLKPESDAALREIQKLLESNPALKVWVVGHTDSTGTLQTNLSLSDARAAAVVKALTAKGIDPKRLGAHGDGPYAPVASNRSEEGRAKNRRVELVEQP